MRAGEVPALRRGDVTLDPGREALRASCSAPTAARPSPTTRCIISGGGSARGRGLLTPPARPATRCTNRGTRAAASSSGRACAWRSSSVCSAIALSAPRSAMPSWPRRRCAPRSRTPVPVEFLNKEKQARYGRYSGEPTPADLARSFYLDDRDRELLAARRSEQHKLGFGLHLCTVRYLGTFLPAPTAVPSSVITHVAAQVGITDACQSPGHVAAGSGRAGRNASASSR